MDYQNKNSTADDPYYEMNKKLKKLITPEDVKRYYKKELNQEQISSIISYFESLSFLLIKARNYEQ